MRSGNDVVHRIVTRFWCKPLPTDGMDWTARFEDCDSSSPVGYGASEIEAIADLLEQEADNREWLAFHDA